MLHQHGPHRHIADNQRHWQCNALRRCQRATHLARVNRRVPHRHPATAALAKGSRGHCPAINPVALLIGEQRAFPLCNLHARHIDNRHEPFAPRIHGHAVIARNPLPFEIDPVEIQVQATNRRIIAHIIGLIRRDLINRRQGPAIDQKPPRHRPHAARRQLRRHVAKMIGGKGRIP